MLNARSITTLTDDDARAVLTELDPDWSDHFRGDDPQFALFWYAADDNSRKDIQDAIRRLGI